MSANPPCSTPSRARAKRKRPIIPFAPLIPTSASSRCRMRGSRCSRKDRQDPGHHPGGGRVRGHRRPGQRRGAGRRSWETNFSPTSAKWTPSCRWCAVLKTRTFITSPAAIDPVRDIETITTELVLCRSGSREEATRAASPKTPSAATKSRWPKTRCLKKLSRI